MEVIIQSKTHVFKVFVDSKIPSYCKGCGKKMFWGKTEQGHSIPISKNSEGKIVAHFADCEKAGDFRNKQSKGN